MSASFSHHQASDVRPLLISGFHRSCTSMTAQALQQAGLYLGQQLIPATSTNADGHFEDVETVTVHDRWLSANNSHWCHGGELPIVDAVETSAAIKAIAKRLSVKNCAWGVKDPRACLFLPYWFDEVDSLCGVFTYRHFANCYESLQRRHGLDLLLNPTVPDTSSPFGSIDLFMEPSLALASWLAYNKGILAQIKRSPERCLLVSQQALLSGYQLIKDVNHRFSTKLDEAAELRIDQAKVRAQQTVFLPSVNPRLINELQQVWEALQHHSIANAVIEPNVIWSHDTKHTNDLSTQTEKSVFSIERAIDTVTNYWDQLGLRDESSCVNGSNSRVGCSDGNNDASVNKTRSSNESIKNSTTAHSEIGQINFNNQAQVNKLVGLTPNLEEQQSLIRTGLSHYPQNAFLHGLLGKCLFNLKQWSDAIVHLDKAAALGSQDPSVYFHTALWHVEHGNTNEAIKFIELALGLNPNADHAVLLINLKLQQSAYEDAKRLSLLACDWFPNDERLTLLHADALSNNQQSREAISWCKENDSGATSYRISSKLYALYNSLDDDLNAQLWDTESQRRKVRQYENYRRDATDVLRSLNTDYARSSLTKIWCNSLHAMTASNIQ